VWIRTKRAEYNMGTTNGRMGSDSMYVLGVIGSPRRHGNTATLVNEAMQPLEANDVETEVLHLSDYTIVGCQGCDGCRETLKCVIDDGMQAIYPRLFAADALILGSPTYFYNVSKEVKAFIDRCYCFEVFDPEDRSVWVSLHEARGGKYAGVISVCEQHNREDMGVTSKIMKRSLQALGYRVIFEENVFGAFAPGDVRKNSPAIESAREAGRRLYRTLKLKDRVAAFNRKA